MAKKTVQEVKLTQAILKMLADDPVLQKFVETKYATAKDRLMHKFRRRKRIEAMVETYKMLLQGGSFVVPGKMVSERCTPLTTYIEVDAQTIMSVICGIIERAPGKLGVKKRPPEKKYTHS